ncbi:MAG: hypothetical protein JXR07_10285 [Reichenbachiella sp.]
MKKIIKLSFLTIALSIFQLTNMFAQGGPGRKGQGREKIEAAKIGLISERLGLSPEDAQAFWPIYNEYNVKRRENHRQFQEARRSYNPDVATEVETRELLKLGRETKERELKLENEYSDRLLNVISTRQLMSLNEAEREFRQMLLNRLDQRRMQQGNKEQNRRENNERMHNKRNN